MTADGTCVKCGKEGKVHGIYWETDGTPIAADDIGDMMCDDCIAAENRKKNSQKNKGGKEKR